MTQSHNDIAVIMLWQGKARRASREAHTILKGHEASRSRVVILDDLVRKLSPLPIDVQEYFKEATNCLEIGLTRAAIVLAWSGFFSVMLEACYSTGESSIRAAGSKWVFASLVELKENNLESQILDALRDAKLIRKNELRVYQGQLTTRNQCAHPTLYKPTLNSAIGFVDDMVMQTLKYIPKP